MINTIQKLVLLPEMYIPAILVVTAIFMLLFAKYKDKFFARYKRMKDEIEQEALNRDAIFSVSGVPKNTDFKLHRLKCPVTYKQFRIIVLLIGLMLAILSIKLLNNPKLAVLSAVIWYLLAHQIVELRYRKHKRKMEEQVELTLQLLVETYKLTEDLIDAIVLVIPSAHSPLKEELELLVKEYRLSKDMNECLKEFADRCDNRDMETFVQGLLLAQHYGSDANMVIQETADIIQERLALRDELENETKGKGFVLYIFLIAVPLVLIGLLTKAPDMREVFLYTSKGQNLLCLALVVQYATWYLSTKKEVIEEL